ncbi:uncharacterized protein LOC135823543 [Sycon ciliatum]|uniref:uncharacterized protein LOC135823543 n=1 Tax=Sycon ciliatum TaxID=27933 RepID=UPI0031F667DF
MGSGQSRKSSSSGSPAVDITSPSDNHSVVECVFSSHEVKQLKKEFFKDHRSGIISRRQFVEAYASFFQFSDSSQIADRIFNAIDRQGRDYIDFQQYLHTLEMTQRGNELQKIRFVFGVFDINGDGVISRQEYTDIQLALGLLAHPSRRSQVLGPVIGRGSASGMSRSSSCGCLATMTVNGSPEQIRAAQRKQSQMSAVRRATQMEIGTSSNSMPSVTSTKSNSVATFPTTTQRLSNMQAESLAWLPDATRCRPPLSATPPLHRRGSSIESPNQAEEMILRTNTMDRRRSRLAPLTPSSPAATAKRSSNGRFPSLYDMSPSFNVSVGSASQFSMTSEEDRQSPSAISDESSVSMASGQQNSWAKLALPSPCASDDEFDDVFANMDTNCDGVVGFEEFISAVRRDSSLLRFLQFSG